MFGLNDGIDVRFDNSYLLVNNLIMDNKDNHLNTLENTDKLRPSDFPPILQKVARVFAESEDIENLTLKGTSEKAGVSYGAVRVAVYEQKQKGRNFNELLNDIVFEFLKNNTNQVDLALYKRAVEGTHRHIETFYRRVGVFGDKSNQIDISINQQFNTLVVPAPEYQPQEWQDIDSD